MPDASTTVLVDPTAGRVTTIRPDGRIQYLDDDGYLVISDRAPRKKLADEDPEDFYRNLADEMSESILSTIGQDQLEGIDSDNQSRQDWLQNAAEAIKLLGLRIEPMRSSGADGAAPLEGMSTAHSPLLLEAVLRGQATASGELLPASGPAKVSNERPPRPTPNPIDNEGSVQGDARKSVLSWIKRWMGGDKAAELEAQLPAQDDDELADALQKDINHYLKTTASEYYPDTMRMLFRTYLFGCEFKKVYNCPIRMRPVSESVPANEVIVNNGATDLRNATRITHRIRMSHSTLIRMQIAGAYRKTRLVETPVEQPDAVERVQKQVSGIALFPSLPGDARHTIMECYCEIDIPGFEHLDKDGEETGLPLPYKVSIDYDTRQVLEVRRDWNPDRPGLPQRRGTFVKFGFVEGIGFYGLGLMHLLGNTTNSMTSIWRLLLDALMFGNFPGWIYSDSLGKQLTNIFRVPPGAGVPIQLNGQQSIRDVAMPLPYQKPDAVSIDLAKFIESQGQRLGGTADTPVGEGKQNAPVGTTLALIEQATKVVSAVHKGLHRSQSEELQMLVDRFREDPEAFWRFNPKPARKWEIEQFLQALDDNDIVPAADPNTPSEMHRIMRAVARVQLAAMAPPGTMDYRAVIEAALRTLGDDPDEFMMDPAASAPQAPQPDPTKMAELASKEKLAGMSHAGKMQEIAAGADAARQDQQMKGAEAIIESRDRQADRQSHENVAAMRLKTEEIRSQVESLENLIRDGHIDPHVGAAMIANVQMAGQPAVHQPSAAPQPPKYPSPGEALWGPPPDYNRPL